MYITRIRTLGKCVRQENTYVDRQNTYVDRQNRYIAGIRLSQNAYVAVYTYVAKTCSRDPSTHVTRCVAIIRDLQNVYPDSPSRKVSYLERAVAKWVVAQMTNGLKCSRTLLKTVPFRNVRRFDLETLRQNYRTYEITAV